MRICILLLAAGLSFAGLASPPEEMSTDAFYLEWNPDWARLGKDADAPAKERLRRYLGELGVTFPEGSSVDYNSAKCALVVHTTKANMALLRRFFEVFDPVPINVCAELFFLALPANTTVDPLAVIQEGGAQVVSRVRVPPTANGSGTAITTVIGKTPVKVQLDMTCGRKRQACDVLLHLTTVPDDGESERKATHRGDLALIDMEHKFLCVDQGPLVVYRQDDRDSRKGTVNCIVFRATIVDARGQPRHAEPGGALPPVPGSTPAQP